MRFGKIQVEKGYLIINMTILFHLEITFETDEVTCNRNRLL